jgi:hypothetical protein
MQGAALPQSASPIRTECGSDRPKTHFRLAKDSQIESEASRNRSGSDRPMLKGASELSEHVAGSLQV